MEEVDYSCHIVGREGVRVNPKKDPDNAGFAPTKALEEFERILGLQWILSQICPQLWLHC